MNAKKAKRLRKEAEKQTEGEPAKRYLAREHIFRVIKHDFKPGYKTATTEDPQIFKDADGIITDIDMDRCERCGKKKEAHLPVAKMLEFRLKPTCTRAVYQELKKS